MQPEPSLIPIGISFIITVYLWFGRPRSPRREYAFLASLAGLSIYGVWMLVWTLLNPYWLVKLFAVFSLVILGGIAFFVRLVLHRMKVDRWARKQLRESEAIILEVLEQLGESERRRGEIERRERP